MNYTAPTVTQLGSLTELTLAHNKLRRFADVMSSGDVIGSLVPVQP